MTSKNQGSSSRDQRAGFKLNQSTQSKHDEPYYSRSINRLREAIDKKSTSMPRGSKHENVHPPATSKPIETPRPKPSETRTRIEQPSSGASKPVTRGERRDPDLSRSTRPHEQSTRRLISSKPDENDDSVSTRAVYGSTRTGRELEHNSLDLDRRDQHRPSRPYPLQPIQPREKHIPNDKEKPKLRSDGQRTSTSTPTRRHDRRDVYPSRTRRVSTGQVDPVLQSIVKTLESDGRRRSVGKHVHWG